MFITEALSAQSTEHYKIQHKYNTVTVLHVQYASFLVTHLFFATLSLYVSYQGLKLS